MNTNPASSIPTESNPLIIAKFGGTSVADYAALTRCAHIIENNPATRVVVVSAAAGVTNRLAALSAGITDVAERERLLTEIMHIQHGITRELQPSPDVNAQLRDYLADMARFSTLIAEQKGDGGTPDALLAMGERCSSLLLAELLRQREVRAIDFDACQVIRTDSHFGHAEPRPKRIGMLAAEYLQPELDDAVVVTQGFIGADAAMRTTTLGRGGSDYSAALFAEALQATALEIWTDVDGIYTCDPRQVPTARPIPELTFAEAAEMATFGAKILHPATLLPAQRGKIPVFVGCTREPEKAGTWIRNHTESRPVCRALSVRRGQTLLTVRSLNMLHARGFLAELFAILARHRISVDLITTSEVSVALTLDPTGSHSSGRRLVTPQLISELEKHCDVAVEEGLALIAVIGHQLTSTPEVASRLFSMIGARNIRMVSHGASPNNLCFLVQEDDASEVLQTLHRGFLEG
ncbi:lysine-sensitive aspartokinase 3 [Aliidiomarina halalkaliphila]|uniref:Aspartokinase n=1 Tax=Aliidiomarina halalkaliphila TaxID=2593535 RepID=A0A552X3H0_9GAMM|nr:lysine-sensitive aspartokinase 3 [Aliidiomarina halalkaliphila]TRW49562.1 lysine-sensitive aspartokinase 3 [Aliidiomarina halalkaliphila]